MQANRLGSCFRPLTLAPSQQERGAVTLIRPQIDRRFEIRGEHAGGVIRLHLSGELDMATVPELERSIEAAEAAGHEAVVLDATYLSFIDSSGLRGVLEAHRRMSERQRTLVLTGAGAQVRRVLELTGTLELLEPKPGA